MLGMEFRTDNEVSLQGIYIGKVIVNKDSKGMERVKVRVMGVHDMNFESPKNAIWAQHCSPSKFNSGEIPDLGDLVYIMFMNNDPMTPIWLGWVRGFNHYEHGPKNDSPPPEKEEP
jgi:hypothetical protein